jgi:hypothetical protein
MRIFFNRTILIPAFFKVIPEQRPHNNTWLATFSLRPDDVVSHE